MNFKNNKQTKNNNIFSRPSILEAEIQSNLVGIEPENVLITKRIWNDTIKGRMGRQNSSQSSEGV